MHLIRSKKLSLVLLLIVAVLSVFFANKLNNKDKIDVILSSTNYSYLPKEAKNYIKDVYNKTGKVILTEKNKETNKLYLNPKYVKYLTATKEEKKEYDEVPNAMVVDYSNNQKYVANSEVPNRYDLRAVNSKNYVTPVRNQGNLGICWAFATAGITESHLLKTQDVSYSDNSKLISERQLDYITSKNGLIDYGSEYQSFVDRSLGGGGNFYISTIALANGVSLFDYNNFKAYNDTDLSRMELKDVIRYDKSLYEVDSTINFPILNLRKSTSELTSSQENLRNNYLQAVKEEIMENGAAYVSTYMDSTCQHYDYDAANVVIDNYECTESGSHAMQIIGWDDDMEYSYCADNKQHKSSTNNCRNVISGKGVWILKNSWGSSTPYPYLAYDSKNTSIHFIDSMQSSSNKVWDNNYILGDGDEILTTNTYELKDSKLRGNETLNKVKFIAEVANANYTVKVYDKNTLLKSFVVSSELPGLITLNVTSDVTLTKDSKITISSEDEFIDKVSIFTSNEDEAPFIDLEKYADTKFFSGKTRLYSETKNIPSGSTITYRLYSNNQNVSDKITYTNNVVAENNINTLINFSSDLEVGKYRLVVVYNSTVINYIDVYITDMVGSGTEDDPYIITNNTQLYEIRNDLNAYYELGNDLDLTKDTHDGGRLSGKSDICPEGFGWEAINNFQGSFDGKGHTIKGLYQKNYVICNNDNEPLYSWSNTGNGLFGSASKNTTIKNLVLEDFDITCYGGTCSALLSKYENEYADKTAYNAVFKNIAIKNSKIRGPQEPNNTLSESTYGGGLFGSMLSENGSIEVSNIYIDMKIDGTRLSAAGPLLTYIQGKNTSIKNIHLTGDLKAGTNYNEKSGFIASVFAYNNTVIKNILSTVTATGVNTNLFTGVWGENFQLDSVNMIGSTSLPLCRNDNCSNGTNINIYEQNNLNKLLNRQLYNSWENFDNNWIIRTVDGVPRIPVLKFMDFDYTTIPDITLHQELNKKVKIYDYITPNIETAKKISFKSNNENIVKISEDGTLIPKSSGNTTIHIESLYDGYIKNVPISIDYTPHYTVNYDPNNGEGEKYSVEVLIGANHSIENNTFNRDNYEFVGWNTKADGTGTSYNESDILNGLDDKQNITLYAQWLGEKRVITFDPAGGNMTPITKEVRYGETYGELPLPTRDNYAFNYWKVGIVPVDSNSEIIGYNLVADWIENAYTIMYHPLGGTLKNPSSTDEYTMLSNRMVITYANFNEDKQIVGSMYKKEGYKFKEWNTEPDGSGESYTNGQTINKSSAANGLVVLYAIWEEDTFEYEINNYTVNETNNYISNISPGTTLEAYTKNITLGTNYTVVVDTKKVNNKDVLYTGSKTKIYKNNTLYREYTNVVSGDTNGDGQIDSADLLKIRQHLLSIRNLTGIYFSASDINKDNLIDSADLLRIRQHLLGIRYIK